jgi:hypothetical protein
VPYVNDFSQTTPACSAAGACDMGFPQIGCQAFKLLAYQRLHEMARHWETQFSTERGRTRAWRKILGRTTGALLRQSGTG